MMSTPRLLIIGSLDRREFFPAADDLRRVAEAVCVETVADALLRLASRQALPVDVILFAQAFPGQWTEADVEAIRREAPFTGIAFLLGSMCEGEARSGRPVLGCKRIYWHQWIPDGREELAALAAGEPSTWRHAPLDDGEDMALLRGERPAPVGDGLILLQSPSRAMQDLLRDACTKYGYSPCFWETVDIVSGRALAAGTPAETVSGTALAAGELAHPPEGRGLAPFRSPPVGVILDGYDVDEQRLATVRNLRDRFPDAVITCLCHCPRIDEYEALLDAGATYVVSKPFALPSLFRLFDCDDVNSDLSA